MMRDRYHGLMLRLLLCGLVMMAAPGLAHFEGNTPPPACDLDHMDGTAMSGWQSMQGKVIYIDFWASWCPPCIKSFPFMNQLAADFHERGLEVVGINLDEKRADADTFLQKIPTHFTVLFDREKHCAADFDVIAMPSTYIIDKRGFIRHIHRGFRAGDTAAVRELVETLLEETN
ncbi:MAG: TlpA disulfide reductase family protein [Nitrosomonas sp.]|nr:TlpA disulfide reductase family protein [Nitrosomonas sp.]